MITFLQKTVNSKTMRDADAQNALTPYQVSGADIRAAWEESVSGTKQTSLAKHDNKLEKP